jgi:hypothetical protein
MNRLHSTNGQARTQAPSSPSPNGNGGGGNHGPGGHFVKGNKAGNRFTKDHQPPRGYACPFLRHMARVRTALFKALTDERVDAMVAALVRMVVQDGNLAAAEFLVRHCVGPELRFNADPDDVDTAEERKRRLAEIADLGHLATQVEAYADGAAEEPS